MDCISSWKTVDRRRQRQWQDPNLSGEEAEQMEKVHF
jgi:hypothetical protein